jgi:hypothetical protein
VVRCSEVIFSKFNIFFASPWCFSKNKRGIENGIGVSIPCGGRFDGGEAGFNIFFTSPWCFSIAKRGIENGVSVPCGGRSDSGEAGDCGVPGDEDGGVGQQRT